MGNKHRHDLGLEDHGSKLAAGTTTAIQTLLGMWIALTFGLLVYAVVDGASGAPSQAGPEAAAGNESRTGEALESR